MIRFCCPSGHHLSVPETVAGKRVRCARCKQIAQVPLLPEEQPSPPSDGNGRPRPAGGGNAAESEKPAATLPASEAHASADDAPVGAAEASASGSETATAEAAAREPSQPETGGKPSAAPPPLPAARKTESQSLPGWPTETSAAARPALPRRAPVLPASKPAAVAPEASPRHRPKRPRRRPVPRAPKLMPSDVYVADAGKITAVRFLAAFLAVTLLFSLSPVFFKGHWDLATAPGWARWVVLLALLQAAYVAWMVNMPDWATVWVVMLLFALVAALYGMASAVAMATPIHQPLPLGMEEVRRSAKAWCGAVMLLMALGTYLCGRTSAKWRRSVELAMAGRYPTRW